MNKPTYTVKKTKDGDYQVTLHNQTRVFQLKEVVLAYMDAQKTLNEVTAQRRLDKAVLQNIKDHHPDVVKLFNKLPRVQKTALLNFISISESIEKSDTRFTDAKRRHDKLKKEMQDIHAVIPEEHKQMTKREKKLLQADQ